MLTPELHFNSISVLFGSTRMKAVDKKLGLIHGVPCSDLDTKVQDSLAM